MKLPPEIHRACLRMRRALARRELHRRGRGVLLAVSGGPDSTALCRLVPLALASRRPGDIDPRGPTAIWVGHVHHGLRGDEADRDERFVRDLAAGLGLPFLEAREDVRALARRRGLSLEAAAREARYAAFEAWARDHPIDTILLGHTAEDQAETVLQRILRGGGLRGLAGMPVERPLRDGQSEAFPRVLRPLLDWRRAEILSLLHLLGQPFREDATNRDLSIQRNRIRHRVLPFLRAELHPGVDRALLRIAAIARSAAKDLDSLARAHLHRAPRAGAASEVALEVALEEEALRGAVPTLRRRILELAIEEARDAARTDRGRRLAPARLAALERWIAEPSARSPRLYLGEGLEARRRLGRLLLGARPEPAASPSTEESSPLPVPGIARWGGWEISSEPVEERGDPVRRGAGARLEEVIDRAALSGPLRVRRRGAGERFRPLGAPGSKRLKEFFRERGVDPRERDGIPVVADGRGIVWVVGHRIAHRARIGLGSGALLRLRARRIESG